MLAIRNKWLRWAVELLLLMAVVWAISAWQSRNMLTSNGNLKVPEINLVSLEGGVTPITEKGKRTLLYFWAPWCRVCAISIGSLQNIDADTLNVVTVAMDYESVEAVENFVTNHEMQSPVLLGTQSLKSSLQIPGYPSYYLIDEEQNIVAKSFGLNTSVGIKVNNWLAQLKETTEKP